MYDGLDSKVDMNVIMLSVAMLAVVNSKSQQAKCVAKPWFVCSDFASRFSAVCYYICAGETKLKRL